MLILGAGAVVSLIVTIFGVCMLGDEYQDRAAAIVGVVGTAITLILFIGCFVMSLIT